MSSGRPHSYFTVLKWYTFCTAVLMSVPWRVWQTVKLFSVHRLLFWCILCSLCGYEWMLLFANWTPHSLTLPWSNSWSDELSEPASPELNGLFPKPWLYEKVWPVGLTHCVNSSCHGLSQKQWWLRRRWMLHVYICTSAADNGNAYWFQLLQLSLREIFCIWDTVLLCSAQEMSWQVARFHE